MEKKVLSTDGKEIRSIELSDDVFGREVSEGSIYYAIRNELANMRIGTASTKTRSEVRGSGAKPWSQKGTGRARAGHRRSPVWVGGGTVFGPKPRDYSYTVPKKMKRAAMKSILSMKAQDDSLVVVEDFSIENGKTKDLSVILKSFTAGERTVMIIKDDDAMMKRAGRNIPWLTILSFNRLRAHDLFYSRKLLVMETAVKNLNEFYAAQAARA
ncbi:50S ribosomal protein L4 [Marispirochaeta sp.]|jgi:large subunit ribosomal protein L4|uniref:50S ribosomal protein L4 n=1 Tax=Marispirochaeta sp. TaxID=2038653 RepID=UPI0029C85AC3|nr:50S ribosomal protein L4 [Marispirochaeta sp.]